MIFRLLLLFLIVWFLIWIIRKQITDRNEEKPQLKSDQAEDMVVCEHCGTHVPSSLVHLQNDKNYCCKEHARLDAQSDDS